MHRIWQIPWRTHHNNVLAYLSGVMDPKVWVAERLSNL